MSVPSLKAHFDEFAADYDRALARGLSLSGEDKDFFARGRLAWLSDCLRELGEAPKSVLDFGCGTGSASRYLLDLPAVQRVVGVDISAKCIEVARHSFGSERAQFVLQAEYDPRGEMDLAFCNGVFHHIPVIERANAVNFIYRAVRRGGLFAFWENNPWNPGTRWVMSRIPFDRDAIMLRPREAGRMLSCGGFQVLRTDYLFTFPKILRWLRWVEPMISPLPVGAQYQLLCRRS